MVTKEEYKDLEWKYKNLEEKYNKLKKDHDEICARIDKIHSQLKPMVKEDYRSKHIDG